MKRKILSTAVAGLLLGSGSVFAHGPLVNPDLEIWLSGATAQDNGIALLFDDLCVAGTLDKYQDIANPSKKGAKHTALFCTIDSSKVTGLTATNPKVLFHKRSDGGSAQGVNPVAEGTAINHMVINNGNCNLVSGTYDCTISNPGDLVPHLSTAGVSDVEPAMFVGVNTPSGYSPMTPALLANLDVTPGAALVFNTPVNKALRDALQRAELGAACVGSETVACMPSLSKNQVASLLSGTIKKWSTLKVNGTSLTAVAGVTAPDNDLVHICRRVRGSGTQATTNAKMNHVPCTPGAKLPTEATNGISGPVTVLNSGSGDVEVCLDDFNNGTNDGGKNGGLKHTWAIGVQSTEKNVDNAHDYRYIKINGIAPTIQNAAKGLYEDWVENSFQWRKSGLIGAPAGDALVMMQKIATDSGSPTIIANNLNPSFVYSWGQGGYLALASHGFAVSTPFSTSNPVTPYSHAAGGQPDSCSVPQIYNLNSSDL